MPSQQFSDNESLEGEILSLIKLSVAGGQGLSSCILPLEFWAM